MYTISIKDVEEGQVLSSPLYSKTGDLIAKSGVLVTPALAEEIAWKCDDNGHVGIFTFSELKPLVGRDSILARGFIDVMLHEFLNGIRISFKGDKSVSDVARRLTGYLLTNTQVLQDLILLKYSHDYTCMHCMNVAVISLQLGLRLGLNEKELEDVVLGSLLHDLGKVAVPKIILDKPAKLDDREFSIIKGHPSAGTRIVHKYMDVNANVHSVIVEHHEKLDGTGYPDRKVASQISDLSRIVAVSDIFDAVTSQRAYHRAAPISRGLSIVLHDMCDGKLDKDVVDALSKSMVLYPVNSFVRLSNGRTGYVIRHDATGLRPLVYDFLGRKFYDLEKDLSLEVLYAV